MLVERLSYEKINLLVGLLRKFQEQDLDMLIPITAPKGMGKSSLAIQLARFFVEKHLNQSFGVAELKKYIAYNNADVYEKVHSLPDYSPLICDEAVRFAMGEDWGKVENKELKKLFAQMRTKHLIVFFCLPRFARLDSKYREDFSTMWIRILERGHAVIFQPDLSEVPDAWHMKEMAEKMGRIGWFSDINNVVKKLRRHACYYDDFIFPPVPAELYKAYMEIRNEAVFTETKEVGKLGKSEIVSFAVFNLMNNWKDIKQAIDNSKMKRPTYDILEQTIFCNPLNKLPTVKNTTLKNWEKKISEFIEKQKV